MLFNRDIYEKVTSFILTYIEENKEYDEIGNITKVNFPTFTDVQMETELSWDDARAYTIMVSARETPWGKEHFGMHTDEDLKEALLKERARAQRFQDKNRINNKAIREYDRLPNALKEMNEEMLRIMRTYKPVFKTSDINKKYWYKEFASILQKVGVIQIGDWHINELIQIAGINSFDIETASKMVRKLIDYAKWKFRSQGITKVVVMGVGDFLNSDRRYDEKLNMATNRTKAAEICFEIMRAMLFDLATHFDKVLFVGVTGNESRVDEELGWSELIMTDNYDYSIYAQLSHQFENHPKVWVPRQESYVEYFLEIAGQGCLLTHGHSKILSGGDVEKGVIQLCGQWIAMRGKKVDHVFFGHKHYTRAGDHFTRSASLPGPNAYSINALQLITKSAQILHTIFENGDIFTERVDLTNLQGITPYPYNKDLEAYNIKSKLKTRPGTTIFQVRI